MVKKDPKSVSGANTTSSRNKQQPHESHKTTAATIARVAAVQEEVKQLSLTPLGNGSCEQPPKAPKESKKHLLLKGQSSPKSATGMAPGATNTAAAISRIAENGAPPLKLSMRYGGHSKSRLKGTSKSSKSSKSSSKSQSSLPSCSPASSRHHSTPSSPGSENPPPLPQRPHPQRSTSAEGASLLSIVKKGREQIQADGSKVAKFFGKKSHEAWDKIKKQKEKDSKSLKSNGNQRDTSNDVDVFGMELKDAVIKTRVVKERKQSGDATYWMPALAYRCLQYLNVHGPHELGIYRISGSTAVVEELRAEFKIHHDIDLFDNPPDDLHTVSSLLKGWFRSLPAAILPDDVQKRVYEKCKDVTDAVKPPQAFIDELSNLPPYNYYLLHHLFSHLSAVSGASDVNKMGLSNLGMIFCSTLRIDRFCFNWLVNSWADCWAGCLTEEYEYERTLSAPRRYPSNASSMSNQSPEFPSRSTSRAETFPNSNSSSNGVDRWPSNSSRQRSNKSPALSTSYRSTSETCSDRFTEAERGNERGAWKREKLREKERSKSCERERSREKSHSRERDRDRDRDSDSEQWADARETPIPTPIPTPSPKPQKMKPRARSPEGSRSAIRKKDIDELNSLRIDTNQMIPRSPALKSGRSSKESDLHSLNVETGCTPRGSISSEAGQGRKADFSSTLGMPLPRIEPISPMTEDGGML